MVVVSCLLVYIYQRCIDKAVCILKDADRRLEYKICNGCFVVVFELYQFVLGFAAAFCFLFAAATKVLGQHIHIYGTQLAHAVMHIYYHTCTDGKINNG